MQTREHLFIGGEWVTPAGSEVIDVISPSTEAVVGRVPHASPADVDRAVAAARAAFDQGPWPHMAPGDRADVMARISQGLQARSQELAETIAAENGSPVSWGIFGQVFSATMVLDYYTELARSYLFEEMRAGITGPALVRHEPVGVAAAIVPWNVPLFVAMMKLAPALASGCTVVLKPAPETPLDAYALAEVAADAGLPPGVLNVVPADRDVSEHLVTHEGIDKVGFTGSTAAGRRIAALCGERLKRVTLELGGKSAAILLDDVDLAAAAPELIRAATMNNGQACVAQTRILAPRDRYQDVVDAVVDAARALQVGDALDPATEIGPLVSARQRDRVEGYIAVGQDEGAKVAVGGGRPENIDRGWFVQPTVFVGVDNGMRIAREEIFGPVAAVIPYDGVDDAIAIANDSEYGLAGSVWTTDVERGIGIAARVRTGSYTVNGLVLAFSAPFGGFKASGIGRELGPEGLTAYLEHKQVNLPMGYERAAPC